MVALLDQLGSTVGNEVVCAVDVVVSPKELAELDGHADVVVRCGFDPLSPPERHLAWLHELCSGRWVLRLDSDEVVSSALLAALPAMLAANDVMQYVIRRRWLFPDAGHMLDERPWSDDSQNRLVRPGAERLPYVFAYHEIVRAPPANRVSMARAATFIIAARCHRIFTVGYFPMATR